jgi:pyridoxal phosphate enzyme (YggS family)
MLIVPQFSPEKLLAVQARIRTAEHAAGRAGDSVRLIAVSKQQPASAVRAAHAAGQLEFGENYPQEASAKQDELADLSAVWHFIGHLQSNKTRAIAERFQWVHTVDRARVAERLSAQRPFHAPPLEVLLQVNLDAEPGKSGAAPGELKALARHVAGLPRLRLRGLMCIPAPETDRTRQREPFRRLRELLESLNADGHALDTLSMGMSDDLEAAILEGATMVRIGTAVFGERGVMR